ncbi:hypothetical protein BGZ63DRAFT_397254 [Mariannaea sp. PMI_226]|nr:hypothetical protein BGZ63DRAFT_397254 [Mariannaea sp. PMI_226]
MSRQDQTQLTIYPSVSSPARILLCPEIDQIKVLVPAPSYDRGFRCYLRVLDWQPSFEDTQHAYHTSNLMQHSAITKVQKKEKYGGVKAGHVFPQVLSIASSHESRQMRVGGRGCGDLQTYLLAYGVHTRASQTGRRITDPHASPRDTVYPGPAYRMHVCASASESSRCDERRQLGRLLVVVQLMHPLERVMGSKLVSAWTTHLDD